MRKQSGQFYGISLEKKVHTAINELFRDGLKQVTVKDVIVQLNYTGNDIGRNLYKRILNAIANLEMEGSIITEKKPGINDIPTKYITSCLEV